MSKIQDSKDKKNQNVLTREEYRQRLASHGKVNVWDLFLNRPYVSVTLIVLAIIFIMTKWWLGLAILIVVAIAGVFIIVKSKNPDRTLSLEFKLGGNKTLHLLKALKLGASMIMFLSTNMRQVVTINFQTTGSQDMLKMLQGAAASTNNVYAAQGANAVGLLDNLLGGSLWGTYRYAANSGQFMNDSAGRWIMIWTFLLMVAPAICVLAQFFREPYSRRAMLVGSGISTVLFILTPTLIHQWANQFAINHQINTAQIGQMFSVGYMAYFGMGCSILVFVIAIIRSIKRDNF